ncbi:hydrogenase maturation protease [Ideonella sp. B7]|nr:hydrogenase maturation protease [Ideonella benzenivorans]
MASPADNAPWLLIAWGNRSRGDDALGPLLLDRLQAWLGQTVGAQAPQVACIEDQQLQVEHALDLLGRRGVLFIDAALDLRQPFAIETLRARRDASFSTHALSPQAVLQAHLDVCRCPPPPSTLLTLRASAFDLGTPPSAQALSDLALAEVWARDWLTRCRRT